MRFADSREPFKPGDEVWVYPGPSAFDYRPLQRMHVVPKQEAELRGSYLQHTDNIIVKDYKGRLYGGKPYITVWPNPYDLILYFLGDLHALLISHKIICDQLHLIVREGTEEQLVFVDTEIIQLGHLVDETAALFRALRREWTETLPQELRDKEHENLN